MSIANDAVFTISAEVANARTVSVQLQTLNDNDLAEASVVDLYLSTDVAGDVLYTASTLTIAAGTDGTRIDNYAASGVHGSARFKSELDGDVDVVLTNSSDATFTVYMHLVLPNGKVRSTTAIAFVDDTP